jgi:hypothetical protein
MRRWAPLRIAAGASGLLCAGVLVLWVRSYWASDGIVWQRASGDGIAISNVKGRLMVASLVKNRPVPEGWESSPAHPGWRVQHGPPDDGGAWGLGSPDHAWHFAGLWYRDGQQLWFRCRSLHVPDWMLLLATAILPALWCETRRRARVAALRQRNGRCLSCGYDLRATPGRCPECGAIPAGTPG